MKKFHPADLLTYLAFGWIAITLLLNFVIPTSWYFQYDRLETSDVCQGDTHRVDGYYWAAWNIPSTGVDHVVTADTGKRKDRFPWDTGMYKQGESVGGWTHVADLVPGDYRIESTELQLKILRIFPVYLGKHERPVSNEFTVLECE